MDEEHKGLSVIHEELEEKVLPRMPQVLHGMLPPFSAEEARPLLEALRLMRAERRDGRERQVDEVSRVEVSQAIQLDDPVLEVIPLCWCGRRGGHAGGHRGAQLRRGAVGGYQPVARLQSERVTRKQAARERQKKEMS